MNTVMNWYNFVFSDKKSHRLQRHLTFWLLWWIYFTASYYHYEQTGLKQIQFESWNILFLTKSVLLLSLHILACYYFTGYLLPRFLLTAKYTALTIRVLLLSLLILLASYFMHAYVFTLLDSAFNLNPATRGQNIWWTSITSGLLSAPKVICAAAAIKLTKRWWIKHYEKEKLEQEKLITDLQLLKAQLHPQFLFSSLNQIYLMTRKKDNKKASALLLKLADLLSYMLYECDNKLVPLTMEIKIIKDYLVLAKARMENKLETDVAVKGDVGDKMIAPMLFLSLVEGSFSFFDYKKPESNWINLEFLVEKHEVTMKLVHGKKLEEESAPLPPTSVENAMKWLNYYYKDHYEFKTTVEPEMMMTSLKILFDEPSRINDKNIYAPDQLIYATA